MGGLAAIGLNIFFRIGISRNAEMELSGHHSASMATQFLEKQGSLWGARRDVITRGGAAIGEVLEALQSGSMVKEGPVKLMASFDEFKLILQLEYQGDAFSLETKKKLDISALLLEEDDTMLDDAMSNMSSHIIKSLADKVSSSEQSGVADLSMQFNH